MTIIRLIQKAKELEEGKEDTDMKDLFFTMPWVELSIGDDSGGPDQIKKLQPPRYIKSHMPFELFAKHFRKHPNLKVIQTLRSPKDVMVSFFHHIQADTSLGGFNGTWDQYFQLFKEQKLPFGDFFDFNAKWYKFNKDRENSLVLKFEEMKRDPRGHVIKIAKFIGSNNLSDEVVDKITEQSQFKVAAPKLNAVIHNFPSWRTEKSHFARKGTSGGWESFFSQVQSEMVDAKFAEYFQPLGLDFDYESMSWK